MHAQSVSLQKNDRISLYTHSDILHFGARGEGQDKTEKFPLYFFPWAFSASLLLILGDFIPLSGLFWKKEVGQSDQF